MNDPKELVVKVVELTGSNYQIGGLQAEQLGQESNWNGPYQNMEKNPDFNCFQAREKLNKVHPNILEEIYGLADGLGIDRNTAIEWYSGYNVIFPEMGCTTLVADSFYVRNYDFSDQLYDARLVLMNPIKGYASIGFSQQIIGRLDGMNEKGLVIGLHFVNQMYKEEGFIATTIVRMILDQCATTDEAIQLIKDIPHGYCYNYSITDKQGKSAIVEASPQKQIVKFATPLVCTNHFESETLKEKNRETIQGSLDRKDYLLKLIKQRLTPLSAYHSFNGNHSKLFFHHYKEYFGTLHTVVYLPNKLEVIVGIGYDSDPLTISLKDWLAGNTVVPKAIKGNIYTN